LQDLACRDWPDYEQKAVKLAMDPDAAKKLKARVAGVRQQPGSLFDSRALVAELESAFLTMWERHLKGLPPAAFHVPPASDMSTRPPC
jgi:predicted O-linked N-acetylglucosamine transferase (SPINDLY family)